MHVVLAGGGTAGHVAPALATADALRRSDPAVGITALGTERGLEKQLVPAHGYELALIPAVPLPRRPSGDLLTLPARLRTAIRNAAEVLHASVADVVVGFGGYVSLPTYLAARRLSVPIVVHEANSIPGLANRIGARLTRHVAVASPQIRLPHATHVGIPLRRSVATLDRAAERAAARAAFGLRPDLPTLLVFGGSQGARRINTAMAGVVAALTAAGIQVLHAVGAGNESAVATVVGDVPYVAVPYVERMELAYAAADLALCRAGAITCAEIAAVGLPAIFVPLPHGNGEQRLNARPLMAAGGALLVDDAALTGTWVAEHVPSLLADGARLAAMSEKGALLGRRDADERLAQMVRRAAAGTGGSW
ncbi:MAG: undecaprenyldiphospho-muramoylpentapeptide beta-N-acetylglucosaminyltransferase [Jiangellaceae bacterium]|nr:undecaprenyldiphospho-muramoylpentapeptide beta-N-acetylglucosaminyltransferase [Jiangellaceae bacterium]